MFGMKKKNKKAALDHWREIYERDRAAYQAELAAIDRRERIFAGTTDIYKPDGTKAAAGASHVRNIVAELIESQVSSSIPMPKVTPMHKEDEALARLIENMLRNELDRLPIEVMNDAQERICPLQGGVMFLTEWDSEIGDGKIAISSLHPRRVIPQEGVVDIEEMDHIAIELPQTKAAIKRRYGVDVEDESETEPEARGETAVNVDELVTQVIVYYRSEDGGIGMFTWAGDTVLEALPDMWARQLRRCLMCGKVTSEETCPDCGEETKASPEEYEELTADVTRSDGTVIPAVVYKTGEDGEPESEQATDSLTGLPAFDEYGMPVMRPVYEQNRIPYFRPTFYPVVLRRNVSRFGTFLGGSDADAIFSQQESTKKLSSKINEKLLKGGSYVVLPPGLAVETTDEEFKVIRATPDQTATIKVITVQADVTSDEARLAQVYEEARQVVGITDSFQGRRDTTATSGKAKEFAAAQTAGRLESKRVMKEAAFSGIFERMFKLMLAYADDERPVSYVDKDGKRQYERFCRYDFLRETPQGYEWNEDFLFSCDPSATLASNREAMWREIRMNYEGGTYGDPQDPATRLLFWTQMEKQNYPGAADIKTHIETQIQAQRAALQAQAAAAAAGGMTPGLGVINEKGSEQM